MTDVSSIYAGGLAMGPEAVDKGLAQARADLDAVLG